MKTHMMICFTSALALIAGCAKTVDTHVAEEKAAVKAAEQWLNLIDNGQYEQSWDTASALFKSHITQKKWVDVIKSALEPLGKVVTRKVFTRQYSTSAPGAPDGQYVVIQFLASYQNKRSALETVTPMLDKDGVWRVSGYFIK